MVAAFEHPLYVVKKGLATQIKLYQVFQFFA